MKQNKNTRSPEPKKQFSQKGKKEISLLFACCLLFMLVYFAAVNIPVPIISFAVTALYMSGLAAFVVIYVVYNYAFTRKNVTAEMLPDDWSPEKKTDYVQKGKDRAEKSRWMIFVIFPLAVTFIADILYLFVWQGWLHQFFSK